MLSGPVAGQAVVDSSLSAVGGQARAQGTAPVRGEHHVVVGVQPQTSVEGRSCWSHFVICSVYTLYSVECRQVQALAARGAGTGIAQAGLSTRPVWYRLCALHLGQGGSFRLCPGLVVAL